MSRKWFSLKKITLTVAAAAMGIVGLTTVGAPPATAASGYTVRLSPVSNPFLFVEVSGASTQPGAAIIQWAYTGGSNQVWTLQRSYPDDLIVNSRSGLCLTTDGVAGHGLFQWPCNAAWSGQHWDTSLEYSNGDARVIRNPASGLYIDVEGGSGLMGARLVGWYRNGANNQQFVPHVV